MRTGVEVVTVSSHAETMALRLLLSRASDNDDAVVLALHTFAGRCTDCTVDIVMALCDMLTAALDAQHRDWEADAAAALCELLDTIEAS